MNCLPSPEYVLIRYQLSRLNKNVDIIEFDKSLEVQSVGDGLAEEVWNFDGLAAEFDKIWAKSVAIRRVSEKNERPGWAPRRLIWLHR
jgi:hypothetical protein